jgi:hypothetical protein
MMVHNNDVHSYWLTRSQRGGNLFEGFVERSEVRSTNGQILSGTVLTIKSLAASQRGLFWVKPSPSTGYVGRRHRQAVCDVDRSEDVLDLRQKGRTDWL